MTWRFRRSIHAESGDRINIGKKTSSLTVGGRGAKATTGDTNAPASAGSSVQPLLRSVPVGVSSNRTDLEHAVAIITRHDEWVRHLDHFAQAARVLAYCVREGETAGPMPLHDIVNMAAVGVIDANAPVLIEGASEWQSLEPEMVATARRIDHPIYFYGSPEGLECGPYQASALRDLFRSYGLPANTPVYRRGDGVWRTLDEFPECCDDETLRAARAIIEHYQAAMAWPRRRVVATIAVTLAIGVAIGFALAGVLMK